jgi:hypothetical protein
MLPMASRQEKKQDRNSASNAGRCKAWHSNSRNEEHIQKKRREQDKSKYRAHAQLAITGAHHDMAGEGAAVGLGLEPFTGPLGKQDWTKKWGMPGKGGRPQPLIAALHRLASAAASAAPSTPSTPPRLHRHSSCCRHRCCTPRACAFCCCCCRRRACRPSKQPPRPQLQTRAARAWACRVAPAGEHQG